MNIDRKNDRDYEWYRYFLKDTVRQKIDFSRTGQFRGEPPPPLQKPCSSNIKRISMPDGAESLSRYGNMSVSEAVYRRESIRNYSTAPFTLDQLSALLWATQGVRKLINGSCALRTVPSAGARHAFETYVAVSRVEGLTAGLYRYLPFEGVLAQQFTDERVGYRAAYACLKQNFVADAAAVFFWTVIPARMEWRYDLAAHKVIAIDIGHVCQNLYLVSTSFDAGICAIAAYNQEECDKLLGVDGKEEFTLYIAAVGRC